MSEHEKHNRWRQGLTLTVLALSLSLLPVWAEVGHPGSASEWQRYSNEKSGISFRYPRGWRLHTRQNPGRFQSLWDNNQLLFCISPDDPDINFNIRLAKGKPPRPFAEKMEPVLMETTRQLNATKLSYGSLSVAGNEAAELYHTLDRGDRILNQRLVVVSRPAVGFIWTFTAPRQSFDSLDNEVFTPILLGTTFFQSRSLLLFWYKMPTWLRGACIGLFIGIVLVLVGKLGGRKSQQSENSGSSSSRAVPQNKTSDNRSST